MALRVGRICRAGLLATGLLPHSAMADTDSFIPLLTITRTDSGIEVVAEVAGPPGSSVDGRLEVSRENGGNTMRSAQGTSLVLSEEGHGRIAAIAINLDADATLAAELTLTTDGRTLATARLQISMASQAD